MPYQVSKIHPVKVLTVDPCPMVQLGLGLLISGHSDLQVVGEAADIAAVAQNSGQSAPDVVVIGCSIGGWGLGDRREDSLLGRAGRVPENCHRPIRLWPLQNRVFRLPVFSNFERGWRKPFVAGWIFCFPGGSSWRRPGTCRAITWNPPVNS